MKVKTSLALSEELIKMIDEVYGEKMNRSAFIEKAVWSYLQRERQSERDRHDLSVLNSKAEKLNKEAEDVLSYQAEL